MHISHYYNIKLHCKSNCVYARDQNEGTFISKSGFYNNESKIEEARILPKTANQVGHECPLTYILL